METAWIYGLIFILVLVEGPISILIFAGLSATGQLNPIFVFITAILGNLTADLVWYSLGYFGNTNWLLRWSKFIRINADKITRLERLVHKHAVKLLLLAKVTNGLTVPVLIATGVTRVSMRHWFPVIFVSNFLISAIIVFIGYYMIVSLRQVEQWIQVLTIAGTVLIVLITGFFLKRIFNQDEIVKKLEIM
jgi:membrane protein DedA with SNARE-associated domain